MDFFERQRKEKEEYQAWLDSLQVGDEVCIESGGYTNSITIYTIEKVTPKRMFVLNKYGLRINPDGSIRGGGSSYTKIKPVTKEILDKVWRMKALQKLRHVKWDEYTNEQLKAIKEVLGL